MKRLAFIPYVFAFLAFALFWVAGAMAKPAGALSVTVAELSQGGAIAEEFAFCAPDGQGKARDGGNKSPAIRWSKGPEGTRSYAIIMVDGDVPTSFDDANKEDKTIPVSLPRQDFYHWVLVDIPPHITSLAEGADSAGVKKTGKSPGRTEYGLRGVNDYGTFMEGVFGGYDGPCPPWNDEIPHRYHFHVYALDVPSLGLSGNFTGKDALHAMEGHVLAKGTMTGMYTLNQALRR